MQNKEIEYKNTYNQGPQRKHMTESMTERMKEYNKPPNSEGIFLKSSGWEAGKGRESGRQSIWVTTARNRMLDLKKHPTDPVDFSWVLRQLLNHQLLHITASPPHHHHHHHNHHHFIYSPPSLQAV